MFYTFLSTVHARTIQSICNRRVDETLKQVLKFVFFILGGSQASEMLFADVSEHFVCSIFIGSVSRKNNVPAYTAYGDGTECSETSAYKIQTPGESPKRNNTTFRTR